MIKSDSQDIFLEVSTCLVPLMDIYRELNRVFSNRYLNLPPPAASSTSLLVVVVHDIPLIHMRKYFIMPKEGLGKYRHRWSNV